jgi:hypothetical protein
MDLQLIACSHSNGDTHDRDREYKGNVTKVAESQNQKPVICISKLNYKLKKYIDVFSTCI